MDHGSFPLSIIPLSTAIPRLDFVEARLSRKGNYTCWRMGFLAGLGMTARSTHGIPRPAICGARNDGNSVVMLSDKAVRRVRRPASTHLPAFPDFGLRTFFLPQRLPAVYIIHRRCRNINLVVGCLINKSPLRITRCRQIINRTCYVDRYR